MGVHSGEYRDLLCSGALKLAEGLVGLSDLANRNSRCPVESEFQVSNERAE